MESHKNVQLKPEPTLNVKWSVYTNIKSIVRVNIRIKPNYMLPTLMLL